MEASTIQERADPKDTECQDQPGEVFEPNNDDPKQKVCDDDSWDFLEEPDFRSNDTPAKSEHSNYMCKSSNYSSDSGTVETFNFYEEQPEERVGYIKTSTLLWIASGLALMVALVCWSIFAEGNDSKA